MSLSQKKQELCLRNRMFLEANRLETFKKWIYNDDKKCNASKMAEAGFYFIGSTRKDKDVVACFMCKKVLDGWAEDDDPWLEHCGHANYCSFASKRKPECDYTLEEFMDAYKQFRSKLFDELEEKVDEVYDKETKIAIKAFRKMVKPLLKKNSS